MKNSFQVKQGKTRLMHESTKGQKKVSIFLIKSLRIFQQALGFLSEGGAVASPDMPFDA